MSRLYLGVDGGQSSTTALIADEAGRIVGRGTGGPCNHVTGPEARTRFFSAVGRCLEQACHEAALDVESVEFAAACLGFSGGAEDKESPTRELIHSGKYKITHDAEIALTGATNRRPGIIVIAGTGSMAFGRNASGRTARAGGWGYIFGDEGAAFDLVRRALRAALRFEEGWGPKTILREYLLAATEARDANDLLHRFYTEEFPRAKVATFASMVTSAAQQGDPVAAEILRAAAADLATLAHGVHRALFRNLEPVPVCYIGGVFRSDAIRTRFADNVQHSIGCIVSPPKYSPAAGAVLEALRLDSNESALSDMPEAEK